MRKTGRPFNETSLAKLYKSHKVTYRNTDTTWRMNRGRQVMVQSQRQDFARELLALLESGKPVIMQDETAMQIWTTLGKMWQPMGRSLPVKVNKTRYPGVTIFGAISNFMPPVFTSGTSTNARDYQRFLEKLREKVPPNITPVYVFDGAKAHTVDASMALLRSFATPMQLPPASSKLNGIEKVWAVVKQYFRRTNARITRIKEVSEE